ncbi:MAG TPA: hypothetical protein RMH99_15070, partial [Sandaracinaceae bacterium LLY-WYZ-13_1]|nr:hypothetical protein [Sandaracinaceae bacterium LLY-WYZ-13_1]
MLAIGLSGCAVLATPPATVRTGIGTEMSPRATEPVVRVETALRPTAFTRERPFDLELGYVLEDPFDGLTRHGASLGASTTL